MLTRGVIYLPGSLKPVTKLSRITWAYKRRYAIHPVTMTADLFQLAHDYSHLPWWALIMLSTVSLRTLTTLPLAIQQCKLIARLELFQPKLVQHKEMLKHSVIIRCRKANMSVEQANKILKKESMIMINKLLYQEGCHPAKMFLLPWVQIPLWILVSLALRDISGIFPGCEALPVPSLAVEGTLWFTNLSKPDRHGILPILLAVTNLINIELHVLGRPSSTRFQRSITNTLRILSIAMCFVALRLPTSMSLYWTTSSGYGLAQNIIMKIPKVRRKLGISVTPKESKHPFKDLAKALSNKRFLWSKHKEN